MEEELLKSLLIGYKIIPVKLLIGALLILEKSLMLLMSLVIRTCDLDINIIHINVCLKLRLKIVKISIQYKL